MLISVKNKVEMILRPEIFPEQVVAGFSTRHGGVSEAPFDSLNLSLSTNDDKKHVLTNRRRLFGAVGFSLDDLAIAGQVHGTAIQEVVEPGLYTGFDGLITKKRGLLLCLTAADCASVLLADMPNGIVGACHAGWRGAVGRIVIDTVDRMVTQGASPASMVAYVSPCISRHHFEVGPEVAEQFDDAFVHYPPGQERPHVDLKAAIRAQLLEAQLEEIHIEIAPYCTYGEKDRFFSYRAEKGKTGRLMGFVGMKL